ncbi:T7SS effector LXG polymorphic toxin [Metabacillus sp. 113a]|uniref:T7SS effector LXG polymorphic toxin n=1 Tax=Metabacillus sp. 113a TaxID=3404706 RepID=UPI003CF959D6
MGKLLDADAFHSGIKETKEKLTSQEEQIKDLESAAKGIVNLGEAFKGESGKGIKLFYEDHHLPLMSSYSTFLESYKETLGKVKSALEALEPAESGFIRKSFLELQLNQDLTVVKDTTSDMTDETNATIDGISDIVGLPKLDDSTFADKVEKARQEKNSTIELLEEFDRDQTTALTSLEKQLQDVNKRVNAMQDMFRSAGIDIMGTTAVQTNSCEKPANTETAAETDKSLLEILGDVFLGIGEAIVQILTEIIVGLFDLLAALFTDPIGLAYGVITTVMNLDEVLSSMVDALVVAWERDFINGDARSRARFVTYGVLSIFGTKGLSKVSKAGSLSKVGKKVSDVDDPDGAKKPKTDIPYNVMNAEQLFNEMKEAVVRNVTKMTDHAVDLVKSKVMKTAVQLKVLSGKMADIIQTAKNVLNPQKINKALKGTYDEMVKGPLVDTKMAIINGLEKAKEFFTLPANINERLAEAAVGVGSGTRTAMDRVKDVVEEIGENVSEIVVGGGKGIDNAKDITKLTVDDIPTAKSGNFNKFFNSLTSSELDELWKDKKIRKKIERQLREPGGLHEWHLVSRAPQFKHWNISAEEIKDLRTAISDVKFVNPNGVHGGLGSTKAHNELLAIIDTSSDYNTFVRRLNNWANYRLEGGVSSLPEGLRLK